ncbi:MAG: ribosome maturation factor RimP [Gammaproteobacteria bacterium]|nr:ribosome maturation factor RimP [Gammaproteobacteria bacterium]MDH5731578.1 ribosome maturation factor RimP [Gammaproteobacteria bacterium]
MKADLQELLEPTVEGLGYELLGIEYIGAGQHSVLRMYIDHPEGIKVEDCEKVSRQVSALLDVEEPLAGRYTLEVSSPGLDRPLFTEAQFLKFIGEKAKIRARTPVNGRRKMTGYLRDVKAGIITVDVDGELIALAVNNIEKANLVPTVNW